MSSLEFFRQKTRNGGAAFLRRWQSASSVSFRLAPYWLGGALTALASVVFSKMFMEGERIVVRWGTNHPGWAWFLIPSGMLASWLIAHWFAPEAVGSGIPQLMATLKGISEGKSLGTKLLGLAVIPVKLVASCICVAAGGVVGREGPMLHIAGCIFHWIYRVWPKRIEFGSRLDQGSMVLAGGAAGLAAAFNTPLGGIVFAVEELAKVHLSQIRTYIFHSVVISGLLAQALLGNYLYLDRVHAGDGSLGNLLRIVPVALFIGFLGGLFSRGATVVTGYRAKLSNRQKAGFTVVCGVLVAFLFFFVGMGSLGSGRHLIVDILRAPGEKGMWLLAIGRGFGSFLTYVGGVVGGIFAPALATGASLGAWFVPMFPGTNPQLFVLVGMVSFLTGVTQTPFTSCVLVLEMTDGHGVIFSLMAAAICALGAAKLVDSHSFYERASERWLAETSA